MRRLPALPHWAQAALLGPKPKPVALLAACLGVAAIAGWGAFAGKAWGQRDLAEQVDLLQADRARLMAGLKQIEQTNAELARDAQEKLAAVREELEDASPHRIAEDVECVHQPPPSSGAPV